MITNGYVSAPIGGRLLGLSPPTAINQHRSEHPELFPNSTPRLFAVADLIAHPLRNSRPLLAGEIERAEHAQSEVRATWRYYKSKAYLSAIKAKSEPAAPVS
jgi:hypothetical protein